MPINEKLALDLLLRVGQKGHPPVNFCQSNSKINKKDME